MRLNLVMGIIVGLLPAFISIIAWVYVKNNTNLRQKISKWQTSNLRTARTFLVPLSIAAIIASVFSTFIIYFGYTQIGYWEFSAYLQSFFMQFFTCTVLGIVLYAPVSRLKRNVFVRHQEHSIKAILKVIASTIVVLLPIGLGFLGAMSKGFESVSKILIYVGFGLSGFLAWAIAKNRANRVEQGIKKGLTQFTNFSKLAGSKISTSILPKMVSCDYCELTHSFKIAKPKWDVWFSTVEFKTPTSKDSTATDYGEAFYFKAKKTTKSPILVTFDKELSGSALPVIETENAAFNDELVVQCDNEEEAFYILTPQVLEQLLEIQNICKRTVFYFEEDAVHVVLYSNDFIERLNANNAGEIFGEIDRLSSLIAATSLASATVSTKGENSDAETILHPSKEEIFDTASSNNEEGGKKRLKRALIITLIAILVVGLITVVAAVPFCSALQGTSNRQSKIQTSQLEESDWQTIDNYLNKKYHLKFTRDQNKYSSKHTSNNYMSITCYYIGPNGENVFVSVHNTSGDAHNLECKDNYQTGIYTKQIMDAIKHNMPIIKNLDMSASAYNEAFPSINDFYNNSKYTSVSVYLDDAQLGNTDPNIEQITQQIISITPFKHLTVYCYGDKNNKKYGIGEYKDGKVSLRNMS